MAEATPRITAPYLDQFSHRTVRILGKVRQLRGEEATVDAGGQIRVHQIKVPNPLSLAPQPINSPITYRLANEGA